MQAPVALQGSSLPARPYGRSPKRAKLAHAAQAAAAPAVAEEPLAASRAKLQDSDVTRYLRRTLPARLLTRAEVLQALDNSVHDNARQHFRAFFSSELGGIVIDPALMAVHLDDHMVHRGHSVFDTCEVVKGHLYALDEHFRRFLNSAAMAGISLSMTQAQMYRAIMETAAASEKMDCHLRFWLSAGRGGFGLSTQECLFSSFYVVAYTVPDPPPPRVPHLEGVKVCSSTVPVKDPFSATVKSTNYLLNALALQNAQRNGFDQGIFVTEDGYVLEGPNMNLGIVTQDNEFIVPPFDQTLAGITMTRLLELLPLYVADKTLNISGITRRYFTKWEAQEAKEVVLTGSGIQVRGVTQWDGVIIGTGAVSDSTICMHGIITEDKAADEMLTPVPYGFLTFSGDWVDPSSAEPGAGDDELVYDDVEDEDAYV